MLVGFAAAELDEAVGRAWIHGPLIDDLVWDPIADALLETLAEAVPRAIVDLELAGDVANVRLAELAARHRFTASDVHHTLTLDREGIAALPTVDAPAPTPELEAELVELHDTLFPATYQPGSTLLQRSGRGESTVVALGDAGSLVAYAAGRIDELGAGYVDYVGVAPHRRGEGHGRTVTVAVIRALHARCAIPSASLVVADANVPALGLYESLGFTKTSSMVGYRRRPEAFG